MQWEIELELEMETQLTSLSRRMSMSTFSNSNKFLLSLIKWKRKQAKRGEKRGRRNKGRGQMAEVKWQRGYREKEEEDLPANRIVQFLPAQFRL